MSDEPAGFALRINGTCLDSEVDCGRTVSPYRACCPADSFCPMSYNVDCCPDSNNCTSTLLETPSCANRTWDLYDNGGYFCCMPGLQGYASTTDSNGCASPGYRFQDGETLLELISAGEDPSTSTTSATSATSETSTTSAASTTSNDPAEATQSNNSDSGGSSNTGAIAGGVVGGVLGIALIAGLAWWLLKKRKNKPSPVVHETAGAQVHEAPTAQVHEAYGHEVRYKPVAQEPTELDTNTNIRAELPS